MLNSRIIVPLTPIVVSMSTFAVEVGNLKNNDTSTLNLFIDGGLGFVNGRYPPILCSPIKSRCYILLSGIAFKHIQVIGTTLILFMIWKICRVSGEAKDLIRMWNYVILYIQ